jgi:hypothetical protein
MQRKNQLTNTNLRTLYQSPAEVAPRCSVHLGYEQDCDRRWGEGLSERMVDECAFESSDHRDDKHQSSNNR